MNRSVSYHLWLTVEPLYCSPKGFAFHATQNYVTYHSPTKRPLLSGILRNFLQDSGQLEQFRFAQHSYSSAHQFRRIESHFGCPRCLTLLTSLEYEHPLKSLNGIDVNKKTSKTWDSQLFHGYCDGIACSCRKDLQFQNVPNFVQTHFFGSGRLGMHGKRRYTSLPSHYSSPFDPVYLHIFTVYSFLYLMDLLI